MELYRLDVKGNMQVWEITRVSHGLTIMYGRLHGEMQHKRVDVATNQSGRTFEEQQDLEYNSRISDQLAKGYRHTMEEASANAGMNELNFYRPMLAQKFESQANVDLMAYLAQPKLDGMRCLITNANGRLIAYSRNGKVIDTIDHILDTLDIPEGMTLDGELYHHDATLQDIMSWAKRKQDDTERLEYHCYDILERNMDCATRVKRLAYVIDGQPKGSMVVAVPTWDMLTCDLDLLFRQVRNDAYEGLILRHKLGEYEIGKRSKGLLKVKEWHDDEFEVIDIELGDGGIAVLVCAIGASQFKVVAPGTYEDKQHIGINADQYIGRMVRVQYANLTPDSKPFHPVATNFREKDHE